MTKNNLSSIKFYSLLFSILLVAGCNADSPQIEVTLSESLRLDDFLAEDHAAKKVTKDTLVVQLDSSWSFSIEVKSPQAESAQIIQSCKEYQSVDRQAEPLKAHEYTAYRALGISCEAVQQALLMQPSNSTFVGDLLFDKALADKLPHDLALVISTEERKRLDGDANFRVWSDVETIQAVEQMETGVYSYKTEGATHVLKRLALGDANGDGVEDLLIRSDVTLDEGSYGASRLFLLTKRSEKQDFEILKSF